MPSKVNPQSATLEKRPVVGFRDAIQTNPYPGNCEPELLILLPVKLPCVFCSAVDKWIVRLGQCIAPWRLARRSFLQFAQAQQSCIEGHQNENRVSVVALPPIQRNRKDFVPQRCVFQPPFSALVPAEMMPTATLRFHHQPNLAYRMKLNECRRRKSFHHL